jgi:hypothetical protein
MSCSRCSRRCSRGRTSAKKPERQSSLCGSILGLETAQVGLWIAPEAAASGPLQTAQAIGERLLDQSGCQRCRRSPATEADQGEGLRLGPCGQQDQQGTGKLDEVEPAQQGCAAALPHGSQTIDHLTFQVGYPRCRGPVRPITERPSLLPASSTTSAVALPCGRLSAIDGTDEAYPVARWGVATGGQNLAALRRHERDDQFSGQCSA